VILGLWLTVICFQIQRRSPDGFNAIVHPCSVHALHCIATFDEIFFTLSMYVDLPTVCTAVLAPSGIPITGQLVPLCTRFFFVFEILAQRDVQVICTSNILSEPNALFTDEIYIR
jgi:hypothetical protein